MANNSHCRSQKLQLTSIDDTVSRSSNYECKRTRKQKRYGYRRNVYYISFSHIVHPLLLLDVFIFYFFRSPIHSFTVYISFLHFSFHLLSTSDYSPFPPFFSFLFSRVFSLRFTLSYRSYTGPTFFPPHCLSLLCSSNFLYVIPCMMFKPFS